ncbi:MAG: dodecin domain-containing protein [Methanomicrobia archaeon]|nr:dodecin domain-containing protein [Methanomicrobia archaeon]
MSVVKILELVGSSEKSWEDAAQSALKEAGETVKNIVGIDILGYKGEVKDNKIVKFKAHIKVAFTVKR